MIDSLVWRRGDELSAAELHDILRLRVDVFVVEQECAYPELDGLDLLATTEHGFLIDDAGAVFANVRLLRADAPARIGRLATRSDHRGSGIAAGLVDAAHRRAGAEGSVLDAQSYLVDWYRGLGWSVTGPEFIEDGIPHVPMQRGPDAAETRKRSGV